MKVILVDDEPIALEVLEFMLSSYKDIKVVGSYTKHLDALEGIKKEKPHAIFLDIEMGDMNGLEVAEIFLRELDTVEIVFVTAYSQYAVDAFEVNAIDYLLKPIQGKRLLKAVERLREKTKENNTDRNEGNIIHNKLRVYSFGGFQVLDNVGNPLAWRTKKAKELFAYLWYKNERLISKDSIIEYIFPDKDMEKASTLIHTTVYQIRKALENLGYSNGIIYIDESYQLNVPLTSDLEELRNMIGLRICNDNDIMKILKIYKGDFLVEGYNWGIESQQMYKELVFGMLERFSENQIENEMFSLILKVSLDKAHEIDPFNEDIARMMLQYYGRQNNRHGLEVFFNNYVERLWKEMNLKPMESTIDIYNKYKEGFYVYK